MGKISSVLKVMQKKWKGSEARSGVDSVPDGTYQARISAAGVNRAKTSGRLQTVLQFTIAAGKYKGRKIYKRDGLETPENISWLKGMLKTLGTKVPSKIMNLPKTLEKLEDELCVIQVKTNGQFTNIYIQKKIDDLDDDIDDEDEDEDDVDEEEEEDTDEEDEDKDDDDDDDDEEEEEEEEEEDEDDEEDEEELEEEEDEPKKKKKKKGKKKKK